MAVFLFGGYCARLIENGLHWVLDVVFGEDRSRIRQKHAGANLAMTRRVAASLPSRAQGKGEWGHEAPQGRLGRYVYATSAARNRCTYSAVALAMKVAAGGLKLRVPPEVAVTALTVGIGPRSEGGFGLDVELRVHLPGLDRSDAERLVEAAHQIGSTPLNRDLGG